MRFMKLMQTVSAIKNRCSYRTVVKPVVKPAKGPFVNSFVNSLILAPSTTTIVYITVIIIGNNTNHPKAAHCSPW